MENRSKIIIEVQVFEKFQNDENVTRIVTQIKSKISDIFGTVNALGTLYKSFLDGRNIYIFTIPNNHIDFKTKCKLCKLELENLSYERKQKYKIDSVRFENFSRPLKLSKRWISEW